MPLLTVDNLIEWACLVVGLLCLRPWTPVPVKVITGLVLVTVINETWVAPYVHFFPYYNKNTSYNIFSFLDMGAWFYLFYALFPPGRKRWVLVAAAGVYAYSLVELCRPRGWVRLHTDSLRVYDLVMIAFSCIYLYGIARKEYHRVRTDPYFWLCAACLFYQCMLFLNFSTLGQSSYWLIEGARYIYYLLQAATNILYYLMISVAFIICYRSKRTSGITSLQP
jgi:hypothetical protein